MVAAGISSIRPVLIGMHIKGSTHFIHRSWDTFATPGTPIK
jgi:hypothetical protein